MRGGAGPRARAPRALAALLVLTALGASARAQPVFQPATKAVLFTPASPDPLVARLEAELSAVGIQVRKLATPPESQLDAAVSRELGAGASAVIRIIARSRAAQVWTRETSTQIVLRPPVRPEATDGDLSVIALRTVEFLRGTLLGVTKAPPPAGVSSPAGRTAGEPARQTATPPPVPAPAGTTPLSSSARLPAATRAADTSAPPTEPSSAEPPVAVAEPPPADRPREAAPSPNVAPQPTGPPVPLEIAAGPAVLASPGGLSPITGVAVIGRGHLWERAGIELMAVFPLLPRRLTNPEGTVEVKAALFGAAAVFVLTSSRWFRVDAAAGAAALMLRASGTAAPNPDVSLSAGVRGSWTGLAHLRLGGGLALNRWLSLRADGIGGVAASPSVIAYDVTDTSGQTTSIDRGTWGRAFVVATLALQARW